METKLMPKPPRRIVVRPAKIVTYVVLILLAITFIFPYLWLITSSLKEPQAIFNPDFTLLPKDINGNLKFVFSNYVDAFKYLEFGTILVNTLIVCIANTVLNLILNSLAGYAFARIPFTGKEIIFKIMLMSMMVPGAVMLIPNLIIVRSIRLDDTLLALILPFIMSIYNIFLLRQQFYALSTEVEEAAQIDGAGRLKSFFVIALPLVSPMLVVLGITTFMWNYNNYLWPLVSAPYVKTLAVSLGALVKQGNANNVNLYPVMLAGSVIVSAPLIILFFFLQRYIIGGITAGAVKG